MSNLYDLTVCYEREPTGVMQARFGWKARSETAGARQRSWRIEVAAREEDLFRRGASLVWSQKGKDGRCACVDGPAVGAELAGGAVYYWGVEVRLEGEVLRAVSRFETGILPAAWGAEWIGRDNAMPRRPIRFRKVFELPAEVRRARLYACPLGLGEVLVNGCPAGDALLFPEQSNYEAVVYYRTFDVAPLLRPGKNTLCATVADGWYGQGLVWGGCMRYGAPKLICRLEAECADGSTVAVVSDESFLTSDSPILSANLYAGEVLDARFAEDGWTEADFAAAGWERAAPATPPEGTLLPILMPPIRAGEPTPPERVTFPDGTDCLALFDFGVNGAGVAALSLPPCPPGAEVTMRFAEELSSEGRPCYRSTGPQYTRVLQQDRYVARGDAEGETFRPKFCYHAFRYVEVAGLPELPAGTAAADCCRAVRLHTDLARRGFFHCSDERLNRFEELGARTVLANFHGFPEDCPGRERCGWLGDAQLTSEAVLQRFSAVSAYEKYLLDVRTSTKTRGFPPMIAPGKRDCGEATPIWAAAQVVLPRNLWLYDGDVAALRDNYADMRQVCTRLFERAEDGILSFGLGDWAPPGGEDNPRRVPVPLSSTAQLYALWRDFGEIATFLGERADAQTAAERVAFLKKGFIDRFFDRRQISFGTLGGNGAALALGLCPPGSEAAVARDTLRLLDEEDLQPSTGIWGNKLLVAAMTEQGYGGILLDALFGPGLNNFGAMMDGGATTLHENFGPPQPQGRDYSLDHPMHFAFASWCFTHLLGIRPLAAAPGFAEFALCPYPVRGMSSAEGSFDSARGPVEVDWTVDGRAFDLRLTVPVNARARLSLPGLDPEIVRGETPLSPRVTESRAADGTRSAFSLGAGRYRIVTRLDLVPPGNFPTFSRGDLFG